MRQEVKLPETRIQPLRIPKGWTIVHNSFREIDPKFLVSDDERWLLFTQDLLQLHFSKKALILDMGWYPDASEKGSYQLVIIQNEDWEHPLIEFDSSDYYEVVENIEKYLNQITNHQL
ncbi:hypothetical protein HOO54_07410 [Bacillus sp. WMMC1349]|uniref:hypothetical protein n=1 Tax=Bacillus sp. WMMC1349 TaxID=2736254 RepID=UPI001555F608|nr:hypothetical protein [Bacillus sp. WMMC1349]NPC92045.1 hypothetical protein [Bacillus sp. WMMC1349]